MNERSWLLFHIMGMNGVWLRNEVSEWENNEQYIYLKTSLSDLKVVSDVAERCIKDIQDYVEAAQNAKYRDDILIVATDHRSIFQDLRKQALL